MIHWLRRGALGCAVGMAVLAVPTAAFAYGPGGANVDFGLTLSVSAGSGGTSVTVAASTGPCTPGGAASISLIEAIPGQTPATLGATTVNSGGGLTPATVVIPTGSPLGVYFMFSTCTGAASAIDVFTGAFVVDGPVPAGAVALFKPATSVSVASHWSTPATRTAVQTALVAAASQAAPTAASVTAAHTTGASASAAATALSGSSLVAAQRALPGAAAQTQAAQRDSLVTWVIVAAAVLGLATTGLLVLRRRRPASR